MWDLTEGPTQFPSSPGTGEPSVAASSQFSVSLCPMPSPSLLYRGLFLRVLPQEASCPQISTPESVSGAPSLRQKLSCMVTGCPVFSLYQAHSQPGDVSQKENRAL